MNHHLTILAAAALLMAACQSSPDTDTGDTSDPTNKPDNDALAACGEQVCGEGFAQRIDLNEPFTLNNMACIVEAMRDRKPGLYRITQDHTWANGGDTADFTLFVTASGEVEVGVHRVFSLEEEQSEKWDPTERCSLKPVAFFDACLTAVNAGEQIDSTQEAFDCVYPGSESDESQELPWFEGCEAKPPACE